jgi:nitrite reductase (NADH) large subunit
LAFWHSHCNFICRLVKAKQIEDGFMKEKLVLIGNGMAGIRTLEELLKVAPDLYDITVFGDEPCTNYNRILLSPVLAGEKKFDDIILNREEWYRENGITLHTGVKVMEIDRIRRKVIARDGLEADYDRLLIATGSNPIMIPVPGVDLQGVVGFRSIKDVEAMLKSAETYSSAAVIGGGLLGLEAAEGLRKQGLNVTVIHLVDRLMERQLDATSAALLQQSLEERGLKFELGAVTQSIVGSTRVSGVKLSDGREIAADMVVMSAGIRPNIALAQAAGLHCEAGIVVNDTMQTFDPRIYAVGECTQHRGQCYGLVAPLFEQAKVAANHLGQIGSSRYEGSIISTQLKVSGIGLFSAGDYLGGEDTQEILVQDASRGIYKKLVVKDNRIQGALLYGDTLDASWYFQLMRDGTNIADMHDQLLFGQGHLGETGHGKSNTGAAMCDTAEVCGCNGVTKGDIVSSITENGIFTLEEVRAHTKASASCGSCTGLVESILAATVGDGYDEAPHKRAVCGCSDYTHDEVRQVIRDNELKTIPDVMHFLEWKNDDGCPTCRPAINYYLLCQWPDEYKDDPYSRHVNERVHANIQKDGSWAVVPRVMGGLTSAANLKAMGEIAEKYQVPGVKITGGQRIALAGIPKEELPDIWKDLNAAGFMSGHAYGKALRSVKSCVGNLLCSYGIRESLELGIALEQMAWGAWTPHKSKLGVSGCPRNCAEATIKDLGLVAVESGWEIYVGGNGGAKVRVADFLHRVSTSEQAREFVAAFLQLYREEGHYKERSANWIERVGLSYLKERLVEDEAGRKELEQRFHYAMQFLQQDPWVEQSGDEYEREYQPIDSIAVSTGLAERQV